MRRVKNLAKNASTRSISAEVSAVVEIHDLRVEFPSRELGKPTKLAVDGLNLGVEAGEVFGFLGPNGAGKTTTMNVLLGFVKPPPGRPRFSGWTCASPSPGSASGICRR